jgi:hypothetical protein
MYLAYTRLVPGAYLSPIDPAHYRIDRAGIARRVSTDSAQGPETTGNDRHQPDNQDAGAGRQTVVRRPVACGK